MVGLAFVIAFAVNADDRFGVRRAQVYPVSIEFNFQPVFRIHRLVFVFQFDLFKYGCCIGTAVEFYLVFGNSVFGVSFAQRGNRALVGRQLRKEQSNAHQRIAAIVQLRHNNAPVAFAANYGLNFFHFLHHVHFANGRSIIGRTVFQLCDLFQGAGTAEVAYSTAFLLPQYIIGNGHQRVFFAKHAAIFTNKTKPVYIGIHRNAQLRLLLGYFG